MDKTVATLDLNLLTALEALLEEGSVSRAADRLARSQPAMSHALKRLRALLGDELLVRVGPGLQLTARAEALREPVKEALAGVRRLLLQDRFEPDSSTRSFRIFVADSAFDLLLPSLLQRLRQQAPHVSIRIQSSFVSTADPGDSAHTLDVAIACVPKWFKGFYQQRLFTDRDACATRRGHSVTRALTQVEGFLDAQHVAVVARDLGEDPIDTWLKREGHRRNVVLSVPHYIQALHVVAQSDLIAVLPERLIRAYADKLGLDVHPVPLDVGTFDEYLLHPARTHADPGCLWLRQTLHDIAKSLGPLLPVPGRRPGGRRN